MSTQGQGLSLRSCAICSGTLNSYKENELVPLCWSHIPKPALFDNHFPQPKEEQIEINGVASTKMPGYYRIYPSGLKALANRLELGEKRKKDKAINFMRLENTTRAMSNNKFVLERMNNCINHIYNAVLKLTGGPDDGEDDAGAIMFCGMILAEYNERKKQRDSVDSSTE